LFHVVRYIVLRIRLYSENAPKVNSLDAMRQLDKFQYSLQKLRPEGGSGVAQ